ncbi:hypothetical protein SAMD00019534_023520 [Acytostelium subglobosum LB1]|uniref:hypothetical protein n=1 Tax=Acytostelium subglobosum LB1 TaxID=1410327 RepID=UPI000644DE7E|nr:hypothetical protein SAMD00019534_023520 [Acytostelium subglobosum LB1]GAM19177.1 hypothetical protein SAMD00019534_023520 [Acytostelium subglobosum LB1]|eukprot:XP_012757104.1 hypothetical protein SAMD00019534_023520 [Acytostelium subglobosum LB1]
MATMEQRTKQLESMLNEFFALDGNNPKRKEIDMHLTNYKAQKDSYEHVKYYLTHTSSQYVYWFSLSILEDKITKSWSTLSNQEQNDTKIFIFDLYLNNKTLPQYITKKLGQVIADIGRIDFYQSSHEYIINISNLVRNPQTSVKGINLLQYISEEFMTTKEVLSQQSKDQLKKLLLEQVPTIIDVLTKYLDQLFVQNAHKKLKQENSLPFQVGSPDTNTYTGSFSVETKNQTKAVFDALLSYFSWIPLNELLTPSLLDTLFKYLRLEKSSIPALTCLNEILSKNCVPKEFEEFLVRIFRQIYSLMTDITTANNISQQYTPEFIEKFTQFIQLFVSNHLRRVESNPNFPITDFLGLFFQYTFMQQSVEAFKVCMDIWMTFLEYLHSQTIEQGLPGPTKYTDGMILLQLELVKRILNAYNNQLSQLDDNEDIDNDMETILSPRAQFIKDCIETITKITEIYPNKGLESLYPLFSQNVTAFFGKAEEMISQGMIDQNDTKLNQMVQDVTTILQLFAGFSHQFVALFVQTFTAGNFIFQKMIDMCRFLTINTTHRYGEDWEMLQVQILSTLRSFSYWLSEYGSQVRTSPNQQPDFDTLILRLINIIVPLFDRTVPEKVSIEAGHLLTSIVSIAKPLNLLNQMDAVIGNIHNICTPLPPAVQSIIYSAISNTILIPPSNFDIRRPKYSPFIKGITCQYLEIPQIQGFIDNKLFNKEEVIQRVQRVLKILAAIIRIYVSNADILESILDFFFTLFESLKSKVGVTFTQQTITTFLEILGGDNIKQLLVGSNETGKVIIRKLIEILTFVIQTYGHSFETLLSSIINFAMEKIYPVIIESDSQLRPLFFTLLFSILDNHWRQFFPSTTTNSAANALMLGNTSISNSMVSNNNNNNNTNNNNTNNNNANNNNNNNNTNTTSQQQLNAIMGAFQTTFQQNDVNLFKQNLDYFEKLNHKHKLYERIAMQEPIFGCSFVGVFFDVLISKVQSVQAEDIINTIYHFASVNFNKFFNEFFTAYLSQKANLTNEQKMSIRTQFKEDKDHPTFNRHMAQFVNDFAYYTYINN